ncbi:MAG TPA: hypothetical protein VGV87_06100 [Blastocatellia bacterium]|nr:hypothetical protein [Blastocatellia bacterium]
MAKNGSVRVKLQLGAVQFDYEGNEVFLSSEMPTLIKAMDELQVSKVIAPLDSMLKNIEESLGTTKEVDDSIDAIKKDLDSMSEMGEIESLRLQMAMDRMSKMMSTLSNLLKKMSDTADGIVQNLK